MFKELLSWGVVLIVIVWILTGLNNLTGLNWNSYTMYLFTPLAFGGAIIIGGLFVVFYLQEHI